jgi:hypothetical protein
VKRENGIVAYCVACGKTHFYEFGKNGLNRVEDWLNGNAIEGRLPDGRYVLGTIIKKHWVVHEHWGDDLSHWYGSPQPGLAYMTLEEYEADQWLKGILS